MLGLGGRTRVCPQCAAEADRRAVWCGWCGAWLAAAARAETAQRTTAPADDPTARVEGGAPDGSVAGGGPGRLMRVAAVVGVLGVVTALVVVARPAPVAESLVGRLDVGSGPTATLPPPPGLAVAWRQPAGTPTEDAWFGGGNGQVAVRGGRVAIGGLVLDRASGEVLADLRAGPLWGNWDLQGEAATLRGDALEVTDVLTGEVLSRTPVDASLAGEGAPYLEPYALARGHGTSLFSGWGPAPPDPDDPYGGPRWVLVGDDGAAVASGTGSAHAWGWARHRSSTHALITLPPEDGPAEPGPEEWSVIELATGREVLRVTPRGDSWQPPRVIGTHALVALARGQPGAGGADLVWDVSLHDLAAERVTWQGELASVESPALHAVTSEGRAVVARRVGSSLQVDLLDGEGVHTVTSVPAPGMGVWSDGPSTAELVGATSEVVVALDETREALVATGVDGTRRWRRSLPPLPDEAWIRLDVVEDLVGLTVDVGDGPRLYLLDLEDGGLLHQVTPGHPRYRDVAEPRVAATIDGLVAVGTGVDTPWEPPPTLAAMDWLDVRDGRQQALDEVVGGWMRGLDVPTDMLDDDGTLDTSGFLRATLSGTVLDQDGRVSPVVVWPEDGGRLELLAGRQGLTWVELPAGAAAPYDAEGHDVVAVADDTLVLRGSDREGLPSTLLVDRVSGTSAVLSSIRPLGVAADVVLGQDEGGNGTTALVAHDLTGQRVRWRIPWAWDDSLAADDQQVVLRQGTVLTAHRPGDGTVLWRTELGRLVTGPVVLTEDTALLDTPYGEVLAIDRADGSLRWRQRVGAPVTALAAAGDHTLVGTRDGTVVQLDAGGVQVQRVTVGSTPVTGVASVGPTVVATVGLEVVGLRPDGTGLTVQDEVGIP